MLLAEPRINTSYSLLGSKIGDELYNKATGEPYGIITDIIEDDSCYYARTPYDCYVVRSYEHNLGFSHLLDGGCPIQTIDAFRSFIKEKRSLKRFVVNKILVVKP